jgi:D-arabinose 5-phosphate isomerase GutQ
LSPASFRRLVEAEDVGDVFAGVVGRRSCRAEKAAATLNEKEYNAVVVAATAYTP